MHCHHSSLGASPGSLSIPWSTTKATRASRLTLLLPLLMTICLVCSGIASAAETTITAPAVIIMPTVGPPTTTVLVSGGGFDPYSAVDIYFDTTDLALATTNGAGVFGLVAGSSQSGISLQVPASAVPGTHWITAVERYGSKAAQKSFVVQTDWAQYRFSPNHKGVNPYENVLSPATVGNLDLHWSTRRARSTFLRRRWPMAWCTSGRDDSNVYALNASTGALLWKYTTGSSVFLRRRWPTAWCTSGLEQ